MSVSHRAISGACVPGGPRAVPGGPGDSTATVLFYATPDPAQALWATDGMTPDPAGAQWAPDVAAPDPAGAQWAYDTTPDPTQSQWAFYS